VGKVYSWWDVTVTVSHKNHVYLHVDADPSILLEISEFFTFMVPGAQFTPQYRAKFWDGKIRLFNTFARELYVGLLTYLEEFCKARNYTLTNTIHEKMDNLDMLDSFLQGLNVHSKRSPIQIRDYQMTAIRDTLTRNRTLLLSPTASGKSLIIYSLMRWHQQHGRRQLIIVPNTSLVEQLYGDFADYASETDWKVSENCARIYSGKEKITSIPIVISTWQSIYKMPKEYFQHFDVVYGDEAHLFKSKSLTAILHKCVNAPFKIGTTGTLDGTKTHRLVLEGLFGAVNKVTTTKKLMDTKQLAHLKITCLQLDYSDEEKKLSKKYTYQEEIDWLVTHPKRNKFITNLAADQKGNTLVLFQYVEKHGKVLHEMLEKKIEGNRKLFFVHGAVDAEAREDIRAITETQNDAIIVASYGTFSTGINIRNLHNIIFASPNKSRIRNLQSIGRGLRKGEEKESCRLYDIADNLSWLSHKNYTLLHMIERIKIYNEEGFKYKLITVPLHG
jgi:superfamily II DNA or RNA helicase